MRKIKNLLTFYKKYEEKHNVILSSTALAYYFIIMLFSVSIIIVYTINNNKIFEPFLMSKIIEIFTDNFYSSIIAILPSFKTSSEIIIYILVLLWSSSSTIYIINRISDNIYSDVKRRNALINRISAFLMFLMLIFVVFFLTFIARLIMYYISLFIKVSIVLVVIRMIIELSVIYLGILILYTYLPPIKIRIRDVALGSLVISLIIYILMELFLLLIKIYTIISLASFIISVISLTFVFVYFLSVVFIWGLVYNKEKINGNKSID